MTHVEADPFVRQRALEGFGAASQDALSAARVAIVGIGGLGCPVAQYLAAAGVGAVTLIDADSVSVTNLHRQVLFGPDDVGKRKVDAAASALRARAPWAHITPVDLRLTDANAADALAGHDVVVDCTDTWLSRYVIADATRALGVPLVWGAVEGWFGQVTVFDARTGLRDIFPQEPDADLAACAGGGVLGTLCGQVGTAMATQAVVVVADAAQGRESGLRGQLTVLDARTGQWRTIPVAGARDA